MAGQYSDMVLRPGVSHGGPQQQTSQSANAYVRPAKRIRREKSDDTYRRTPSSPEDTESVTDAIISKGEYNGLMQVNQNAIGRQRSVNLPVNNHRYNAALEAFSMSSYNYAQLLDEYGYFCVVDAAWSDSKAQMHPFFKDREVGLCSAEDWRINGVHVLAATPYEVLYSLLDGSLSRKVEDNKTAPNGIGQYFERNNIDPDHLHPYAARQLETFAPTIYARVLVDDAGNSPSPEILRCVITRLRQYIAGDEGYYGVVASIDNQSRQNRSDVDRIRQGLHYYLNGSEERVENVITFCHALELRLNEVGPVGSPAASQPLSIPLVYMGFTVNESQRRKQHSNGLTNWLSALVLDICRLEFRNPDETPVFSFKTYVVAFTVNRTECRIAEELFSRMTSAYYYTGRGFNISPAGISVSASNLSALPHGEALHLWEKCLNYRQESGDYATQLQKDIQEKHPKYKIFASEAQSKLHRDQQQRREARQKMLREQIGLEEAIDDEKNTSPTLDTLQDRYTELTNRQRQNEDICRDENGVKKVLTQSHTITSNSLTRFFETIEGEEYGSSSDSESL